MGSRYFKIDIGKNRERRRVVNGKNAFVQEMPEPYRPELKS